MTFYRFRSVEAFLGEFQELERQEIYCAAELGACVSWVLIKSHAFNDGNKRIVYLMGKPACGFCMK